MDDRRLKSEVDPRQHPVAVKWVTIYQTVHDKRILVGSYGLVYPVKER